MVSEDMFAIDRHILHRTVRAGLLYQGTMAGKIRLAIYSSKLENINVRSNRTVYIGIMLVYWR
jgi:hypothetical protein